MTFHALYLSSTSVQAIAWYTNMIALKKKREKRMESYFQDVVYVRKLSVEERRLLQESGQSDFRYGVFEGESGCDIFYTHYEIAAVKYARAYGLTPMVIQ